MSKRNLIWLAVIVAVGVAVGIAAGPILGLVSGGSVLVISEITERLRRSRRARDAGTAAPTLRDAFPTRRTKR